MGRAQVTQVDFLKIAVFGLKTLNNGSTRELMTLKIVVVV